MIGALWKNNQKFLLPLALLFFVTSVSSLHLGLISDPLWIFVGVLVIIKNYQNNSIQEENPLWRVYILPLMPWVVCGILIWVLSFSIEGYFASAFGFPGAFIVIIWSGLFIWKKFSPGRRIKSFYVIVQILWLLITAIIYYFLWPADIFFTVLLLPSWLFLGIAWFWVFIMNQRWWSLVGIAVSFPIILFFIQIGTSRLGFWVTERQLDRFITFASEGELIDNIELSAYGGVKIADFMADSTTDYEIMYLDTLLFGADEYRIDFTTGVTYHVSIHGPLENGHWYISLNTWRYDTDE